MAMCLATGMSFAQGNQNGQDLDANVILIDGQESKINQTTGTPVDVVQWVADGKPATADCEVGQIVLPDGFMDQIKEGRNKVAVRQVGDLNEANGTQDGMGNYSLIRQNNTNFLPEPDGNLASTYQLGDNNGASIKQFGDANDGRIVQLGDDNIAIQDVGSDTAMASEGNLAYAKQEGDGNKTSQSQHYDNNQATAYTIGDNNTIIQDQTSGPNQSTGNIAFVNQIGDYNNVKQLQDGSNNSASVYQTGDRNTSVETQTMNGDSMEFTNFSTVNQVGFDNISCVTQDADMARNSSCVNQIGNDNSSLVSQTVVSGFKNASCVQQTGNENTAQVTQVNKTIN